MGDQTFRTAHALDGKPDKDRVKLNGTFVTAVTDQTANLPTGTLYPVELQAVDHAVIIVLRKIIASFKDNCYHKIGESTKGHCSWCCQKKDRTAMGGGTCLFCWDLLPPWKAFFYGYETMIT